MRERARQVSTLKHELWQTIQAHNHNADLLKHHKDAIDQVQARMTDALRKFVAVNGCKFMECWYLLLYV